MTFDEATRAAAKVADKAVRATMGKYATKNVYDEDDISGYLVGRLDEAFDNSNIGGLMWSATVLRHRKGMAAQEKRVGADMIFHVKMDTPTVKYSKGVLVQAKKIGPNRILTPMGRTELNAQCNKMLHETPDAFVFDYATEGMRCDSALKVVGSTRPDLYQECVWTSYRFFRELFRCPIGDPRIISANFYDLPVSGGISLLGEGEFSRSH